MTNHYCSSSWIVTTVVMRIFPTTVVMHIVATVVMIRIVATTVMIRIVTLVLMRVVTTMRVGNDAFCYCINDANCYH